MQLVLLDAERAVNALPKLLNQTSPRGRRRWELFVGCCLLAVRWKGRARLALRGSKRCWALKRQQAAFVGLRGLKRWSRPRRLRTMKYDRLIAAARNEATIKVAVAHPCDDVSLRGAVEAMKLGLIEPILVGPIERLRSVAAKASGNRYRGDGDRLHRNIVTTSATKAVELVVAGRAEALMKGKLAYR